MIKKYSIFLLFLAFMAGLNAQMIPVNRTVIDDLLKHSPDLSSSKRSIQNPQNCSSDTVEYPRYKASSLITISVAKGRGIGQLYSAPKPLVLSGFTFYAFVAANPPSPKKMKIICRVYKAGLDSLPRGNPLRADTMIIDSTFGGGLLSRIEKKAKFKPITLDSNYILTVETEEDSLSAGIVINNYNNRDGKRENLNSGSISGLWYNGRNLNVGGTPFDCDILLHPHVQYKFGNDFIIKDDCYNLKDSIQFLNLAAQNMAGSKMYNRYMQFNLEYWCHRWDLGNSTGTYYSLDQKVKYTSKQNYKVKLISIVFGYKGDMFNGCNDTTEKLLVFKPDIPTFSGLSNVCIGDSAKYTAITADTGVVFEWLAKPNSPSPFHIGKTMTKYPVTKNDTFYLRANNRGCLSGLRTIIIRANAYPTVLNVLNDSVCSGSRANLKASTDVGILQWYSNPLGGLPLYTGEVFQTNVLTKDTTFYVQANNNGCYLNPRQAVSALVGSAFAPIAPSVSNDTTVCLSAGNVITLSATAGSGLSTRWFNVASGGSSIHTGSTFNFLPVKREVKVFYADAYNGVCGSTRVPITITVEEYPLLSNVKNEVICKGDSARLSYSIPYGEGDWYDASSGGNLIHSGTSYHLLPQQSVDFYVESRSGVCVNPQRTKISATVNTYPSITKIWGDTICSKNTAKLKTVLNGPGSIEWFDSDTSTPVLGSGNIFTTPVLNGSRKYYAQPSYAGCVGPRQAAQPLVKAAPFSGFSFEVLGWQQVRVSPINAGGAIIKWDFGDGTTSNNQNVTHRYTNPGTYLIKLILTSVSTGCKDSTVVPVLVELSSLQETTLLPTLKAYPNPVSQELFFPVDFLKESRLIQIFDSKGSLIETLITKPESGQEGIDVSRLSQGVYILQVHGYKPLLFIKA